MAEKASLSTKVLSICFVASMPSLLPVLDVMHHVLVTGAEGVETGLLQVPFMWTMDITAMFTALAVLLVCLFKTDYEGLSNKIVYIGAACYLLGYLSLFIIYIVPDQAGFVCELAGAPLGVGMSIACMAWARQLELPGFRDSIAMISKALIVTVVVAVAGFLLPPMAGLAMYAALACAGVFGCLHGLKTPAPVQESVTGSNWWDVFGKLDLSLVEGENEQKTLASRVLFFIVTPCLMLLVFLMAENIPNSPNPIGITLSTMAVGGAALLAIPCRFIRDERSLVNFSFRLYLPIVGLGVFVVNAFASFDVQPVVMAIGAATTSCLYIILLCSMLSTMSGRMKSLTLPSTSMLVIGMCLVALLSYTKMSGGIFQPNLLYIMMVVFVITIGALLATQSSQVWRLVMQGVAAVERDASETISENCASLAKSKGLTARESEILPYLARGHGSAFIAEELVVAESTVRSHVKSIYSKLDVSSREELIELVDAESKK